MKITSQAFANGGNIPHKYTKYGDNRIPPLHLEGIPENTKSLALIVDDPDTPRGTFNHWIVFNVDPGINDIKEDCVPFMAVQGQNDFGESKYGGPRPPSGEHRYFFRAYALDTVLGARQGSRRDAVEKEMQGHVLDNATLMGKYAH